MKIAIIHHQLAKKGGMEAYLFNLILGFIAQGDDVTVFTYRVDNDVCIPTKCKIVKYDLRSILKFFRKYLFDRRIDKSFPRQDFDLSLSLTRTANQDIVISGGTHRGYLKQRTANLWLKLNFKNINEINREQKSFDKSKIIIAHSSSVFAEIEKLYNIERKKITLLYPPLDTKKYYYFDKSKRRLSKKRFGIDKRKTTLLFPSTGHKRKGWNELTAALEMLPENEFELLVAGTPIDDKNKTKRNIRYLGFIDNMADLYAATDFTVLPAHYEPFGLVAIESVQCGTPVIISDKVAAGELLSANEAIILSPVTAESIIAALNKAKKRRFTILPGFAEKNHLTIQTHISAIKKIYQNSLT